MTKKTGLFIRQFVIGLGLLSGIFTAVGIDPQLVVINVVGSAAASAYPDQKISYLILILPTVLLLISLAAAYLKGKLLGLVSVLVAYCAGIFVLTSTGIGLLLLSTAVVLGVLATNRRLLRKMKA
jgi:hypothetical protein